MARRGKSTETSVSVAVAEPANKANSDDAPEPTFEQLRDAYLDQTERANAWILTEADWKELHAQAVSQRGDDRLEDVFERVVDLHLDPSALPETAQEPEPAADDGGPEPGSDGQGNGPGDTVEDSVAVDGQDQMASPAPPEEPPAPPPLPTLEELRDRYLEQTDSTEAFLLTEEAWRRIYQQVVDKAAETTGEGPGDPVDPKQLATDFAKAVDRFLNPRTSPGPANSPGNASAPPSEAPGNASAPPAGSLSDADRTVIFSIQAEIEYQVDSGQIALLDMAISQFLVMVSQAGIDVGHPQAMDALENLWLRSPLRGETETWMSEKSLWRAPLMAMLEQFMTEPNDWKYAGRPRPAVPAALAWTAWQGCLVRSGYRWSPPRRMEEITAFGKEAWSRLINRADIDFQAAWNDAVGRGLDASLEICDSSRDASPVMAANDWCRQVAWPLLAMFGDVRNQPQAVYYDQAIELIQAARNRLGCPSDSYPFGPGGSAQEMFDFPDADWTEENRQEAVALMRLLEGDRRSPPTLPSDDPVLNFDYALRAQAESFRRQT